MWEGHSRLWRHHGTMTTCGVWTSANTLALIVWHNTVQGEAGEETSEMGGAGSRGPYHAEFEFHSLDDKEPSKCLLMEGREGKNCIRTVQ